MSAPAPADFKVFDPTSASADERMTRERSETKYLIAPEDTAALIRQLALHLPAHRFNGDGANRLPDPLHFVTTVYFDTDSRAHYRAAANDLQHNVKLRAKEYYDLHPSLAEVATDPRQIARIQPWVWFELKRREGSRTRKRRFRVPKQRLPEIFVAGQLVPEALAQPGEGLEADSNELREIVRYCESLGETLSVSCIVNYRRLSFQDHACGLRITVDQGLSFFAPPPNPWSFEHPLVRSSLGVPSGALREAVLEVKRRAASPAWLAQVLARAGAPLPFSKFVAGSRAVHGESSER